MSRGGVHQFVPMLHRADAVGCHAIALQDLLHEAGVDSEIYVEIDDPQTVNRTRPFASYTTDARPGDLLVYQLATASEMADQIAARPEALVVNHHNVTPPELFGPWDEGLAHHQLWAQLQLMMLAKLATLGVAVSEVNRSQLTEAGCVATAVVSPIVDVPRTAGAQGPAYPRRGARERGALWLAVGRVAPNKAIEDALAGLFAYRRYYDPDARLLVVGKPAVASYVQALRRYTADLGLWPAVRFAGKVDDEELDAAYREADALVVTSEHEGFCLPVVEAMARGLPVVAYSQGALPEVLGDAGVLLASKAPLEVAGAVHRLQSDGAWRRSRIEAGYSRLAQLEIGRAGTRMVELLLAERDRVTG